MEPVIAKMALLYFPHFHDTVPSFPVLWGIGVSVEVEIPRSPSETERSQPDTVRRAHVGSAGVGREVTGDSTECERRLGVRLRSQS